MIMAKNDFLARQRATQKAYFDEGLKCGRQQIIDMVSLVLRDKDIMGKDTFGKDRLLGVVQGIGEYMDTYEKAWLKDDEADYYQKKMDDALAEAYGEQLHDSFHERYEVIPEQDSKTGRWK
jgi:cobalamin-dependent methionine synthase I